MNFIEHVEIKGFWGDKDISIPFNQDVNFLIGVNGSGKTTVINLIAAALNADFYTLDRLPFQRVSIQLKEVSGAKKPSIEVEKKPNRNSPFPEISFKIKDKASDKPVQYSLDELEEERIYRARPTEYFHPASPRFKSIRAKTQRDVIEHLKGLVNVSWLSIHRSSAPYRAREERSYESTVDQKLAYLSNDLLKYFSLLDKLSAVETDKFQQTIFLSLLTDEKEKTVFSFLKRLDYEKEKEALIQIFKLFNVDEKKFSNKVEGHFNSYASAIERLNREKNFKFDDLAVLLGTRRIHSVVQDWNHLTQKQKIIYQPKDTFLKVVNKLIQRKSIYVNEKNELEVLTQSGKKFPLQFLSSGEKQLIIILGEALLQESSPWIYIADEPELSLHVTWQENLVRNLRAINPNAQIVFATHSPDIVSDFDKNVFDMEEVVK